MIDVSTAREFIVKHANTLAAEQVWLTNSPGRLLREDVASDVDSPPHTKSLVDGYAVVASETDRRRGDCHLKVIEEVVAGNTPMKTVTPGSATRVMTGAPIPAGADAMVMVEHTSLSSEGDMVTIHTRVSAGANILPQGAITKSGDVVLKAGATINPAAVGVLAEVGRTSVLASSLPRVAIAATGNELTAPDSKPAAGKIRDSNGPQLEALAKQMGARTIDLGIIADEREALHEAIRLGLEHDVFLISGGVSAGVFDLTPDALEACGVKKIFHKIKLKPGKPLWFGVAEHEDRNTLVFGLPGNPVSGFVCFHLFVKYALDLMVGKPPIKLPMRRGMLGDATIRPSARDTFWPAKKPTGESSIVQILNWKGSSDLVALARADCLAMFPADTELRRGDTVGYVEI